MNGKHIAALSRFACRVMLCSGLALASASAQELVDVRLEIPMGKALLIEGDLSAEVVLELVVNGEREAQRAVTTDSFRYLDEYELLTSEGERGTRDILSHLAELNGDVVDPPTQGVSFLWTRADGQMHVGLDGPQVMSLKFINQQLNAFNSLWLWVQFPEALAPGSEVELDLMPVAPLLLSLEAEFESASMTGVFESQDAKGRARFVGQLAARGRSLTAGLVAEFTGELTLVIAPAEGRIVSIESEGEIAFVLPHGVDGSARGTFSSSVVTSLPRDPDRLRRGKHKIRMATRSSKSLAVSVALPSYWGPLETDEFELKLLRSVDNDALGDALITFEFIEGDNDDLGAFRDDLERDLRESGDEFSVDSPKSGLGKGLGLELMIDDEGIDTVVRTEFYPLRTGWLAFKLTAPQKLFDAAFAEFKKSRKSLELVD